MKPRLAFPKSRHTSVIVLGHRHTYPLCAFLHVNSGESPNSSYCNFIVLFLIVQLSISDIPLPLVVFETYLFTLDEHSRYDMKYLKLLA